MTATALVDIRAAPDRVFDAIADMDEYARAIPGTETTGLQGGKRKGIGTKFVQTRHFAPHPSEAQIEVTYYDRPRKIQMVALQDGTSYDATYMIQKTPEGSRLVVEVEASAPSPVARLLMPLRMNGVAKRLRAELDALRTYCE